MSAKDNPFASGQGGYGAQNVQFGGADAGNGAAQPATSGAAGGDLVKDTTTAGFQQDVIAESRNQPVLVDFWAPWCGPCRQLAPLIEAAVRKAGGKVKLVKMNIDEHPAIAGQMGVQSIPAVVAFHNGQPVDGFMGAVPETQIEEFIKRLVAGAGGDSQEQAVGQALEAANAAREAGDVNQAAQIYQMILQQVPDNAAAYAGLAGMLLDAGETDKARQMIAQAPESIAESAELASVRARLELAEKVAGLGDPAELERRLAGNPDDHDARFDLAQIRNATGDREAAADLLLEIMRADREWRDDGARKELLKFFEAWGPTDPATVKARRKLSSMLFR
ncbi:thioredoxin [Oricola thermophila]|uniref:Thioredoxin n=1 Tax=Oricola thermophila TaxID=2742145 RepID=A0A6N1VKY1_9HYPH|nr:thioredoxin [Oricola thermophila]QKV19869.1 thioredoxin [Oricola thermophila]